jgi:hypothetical protein
MLHARIAAFIADIEQTAQHVFLQDGHIECCQLDVGIAACPRIDL